MAREKIEWGVVTLKETIGLETVYTKWNIITVEQFVLVVTKRFKFVNTLFYKQLV